MAYNTAFNSTVSACSGLFANAPRVLHDSASLLFYLCTFVHVILCGWIKGDIIISELFLYKYSTVLTPVHVPVYYDFIGMNG